MHNPDETARAAPRACVRVLVEDFRHGVLTRTGVGEFFVCGRAFRAQMRVMLRIEFNGEDHVYVTPRMLWRMRVWWLPIFAAYGCSGVAALFGRCMYSGGVLESAFEVVDSYLRVSRDREELKENECELGADVWGDFAHMMKNRSRLGYLGKIYWPGSEFECVAADAARVRARVEESRLLRSLEGVV